MSLRRQSIQLQFKDILLTLGFRYKRKPLDVTLTLKLGVFQQIWSPSINSGWTTCLCSLRFSFYFVFALHLQGRKLFLSGGLRYIHMYIAPICDSHTTLHDLSASLSLLSHSLLPCSLQALNHHPCLMLPSSFFPFSLLMKTVWCLLLWLSTVPAVVLNCGCTLEVT